MYKVALFIGRFQPLHNGHVYSYKKALTIAESVKIVIAKSNVWGTEDDPWHWRTRRAWVKKVFGQEAIVCPDNPSDAVWLREVRKRAGKFDVVVSNNPWVLSIMKNAGIATYETGLWKREELEGIKIRKMMRKENPEWKLRVPEAVAREIDVLAVHKGNPLGF